MLCRNPYTTSDGKAYGCGQCMPCRVNRRRKWQARMMLEAGQYVDNTFLTLTYDDANIPTSASGLATLSPPDLRGFLDRLRWHYGTLGRRGIRFYAVGEYGDLSMRPHYHVALFNHPNCSFGMSVYNRFRLRCCPVCELVRKIWGKGHVYLGSLERDSAGYVAGYITKKMTKADDPRLGDRYPEFARMSLRPGIGANAMFEVADVLMKYGLDKALDVPLQLASGRKSMPLDRYMRKKLRTFIGRDEKAPQEVVDEVAQELSDVYARSFVGPPHRRSFSKEIFKAMILDDGDNDFAAFAHRRRLFNKQRGTL